jgi:hypothetical protein
MLAVALGFQGEAVLEGERAGGEGAANGGDFVEVGRGHGKWLASAPR